MLDFFKRRKEQRRLKLEEEERLKEKKRFVLTHTAESYIQWTNSGKNVENKDRPPICVLFFENGFNERKYEVKAGYEIKQSFLSTSWYGKCEIWIAGGIIPEWATCVVAEKLSR